MSNHDRDDTVAIMGCGFVAMLLFAFYATVQVLYKMSDDAVKERESQQPRHMQK